MISWGFVVFLVPSLLWAAVPKSLAPALTENQRLLREALRLPLENRIQALKAQGPQVYDQLSGLAFSRHQALEIRWRSLTALPYLDAHRGQTDIERALKSDEWYLRNAATLALPALARPLAIELSTQLLSDPALVVRTAAAQNLLKLNARDKELVLWEKLNSPENFHRGQSLWVRRHIARALAEFARPGKENKLIAMLKDPDERLHPYAIRGLERLTGQRQPKRPLSLAENRGRWLAWWRDREPATQGF